MKEIFLGKPLYWLLWVVVMVAFYVLGAHHFHTREFNLFVLILLTLAAACVLLIVLTYRKGERITREPFEED